MLLVVSPSTSIFTLVRAVGAGLTLIDNVATALRVAPFAVHAVNATTDALSPNAVDAEGAERQATSVTKTTAMQRRLITTAAWHVRPPLRRDARAHWLPRPTVVLRQRGSTPRRRLQSQRQRH